MNNPAFTSSRPALSALFTFVLGLAISAALVYELDAANRARSEREFATLADAVATQIAARFEIYEHGLRGVRGAVVSAGAEHISRERFHAYTSSLDLDRAMPGALGVGFIRRVAPEQQANFLRAARHDGTPDFTLRQFEAHAGEHYVIQYIEPQAPNQAAIGLDIASEARRRTAAASAMRSGKPELTAPITLIQEQGKQMRGFLLLLPVYQERIAITGDREAEQAALGWTYAALVMDDILKNLATPSGDYTLAVQDHSTAASPERMYASPGADGPAAGGLARTLRLPLYGRTWALDVRATPEFLLGLNLNDPLPAGLAGALISALAAGAAYLYLRGRRREAEAALEHARLAAIVTNSGDAIIGKDLQGVVTSWNQAAERIFGYGAEQAIGQPVLDLIIPAERRAEEAHILARIGRGETVAQFVSVRRHRDGHLIDISATVSPLFGADGKIQGAASIVRDMSERLQLERQLRDALTRAKLAVEAAGIGIWVWQLTDNRLIWDDRMFALYDAPPDLAQSGLFYEFWRARVHPEDLPRAERSLQEQVLNTGLFAECFRIVLGDGSVRHIQANAVVEHDDDGAVLQVVGINRDVTDQVLAEQRIRDMNASLEQQVTERTRELHEALDTSRLANKAKSDFLANMSHEIRTPMNAILGLAHMLEKQMLNPDAHGMVQKIRRAGRSLLELINDILDFSKIEAQRLEIEHAPFRLCEVLDNVAAILAPAVGAKPIEVVIDSPPAGTNYLLGDGLRLNQVLINLAGNAVKFTERGDVHVRVTRLAAADTTGRAKLRFAVRDTGIGIAADKQRTIFEAFTQADSSTSRNFGGTGLGLAISSRLVQLMGGELALTSQPGLGSEFSFELEFTLSDAAELGQQGCAHQRILVADDHDAARTSLCEAAASLGWGFEAVCCGRQAIKAVRDGSDVPYDALLLDWRMPEMDGLAAAEAIRKQCGDAPGTPILIMASAHERDSLRQHAGKLVDAILTKPVTGSTLYDAVNEARRQRGGSRPEQGLRPCANRLAGVRALVVDDSELNREVADRVLSSEGARVELAGDGRQALSILNARPGGFDIVLMDMQMPLVDGYGATREIRATPALADLPVLALTAGAFSSQRDAALEAGVNGYVAKPFDIDVLIEAVRGLARRAHSAAVPIAPSVQPATCAGKAGECANASCRPAEPADANLPLIDTERAGRLWRKMDMYHSNLRMFVRSHAADGGEILSALNAGDEPRARAIAHKLCGAAGALALMRAAEDARELERALHERQDGRASARRLDLSLQESCRAIADFAGSEALQAPSANDGGKPAAGKRRLIERALKALDCDAPDQIEAMLPDLAQVLPAAQTERLRGHISAFDFRSAEALLERAIADSIVHLQD
ncbi:MAG: CHASE domain-containing protein [Rhodocyclaceae bacterium]|nr:CHASE domain-containing protein [Rhodocyclaceae bacterium]MBX3667883.1 CHASE domain-containing protein [Rhodocyclaceae bacterium]